MNVAALLAWAIVLAIAAACGGCNGAARPVDRARAIDLAAVPSRTQQAIGGNRPVMLVEGEVVAWDRVVPLLVDSPAGEMATRLVVLESAARRELAARHGVAADAQLDRGMIEGERARLLAEIAGSLEDAQHNADAAQRVMQEAAQARGLGPAALEQSLLVRGLVREIVRREGQGLANVDEEGKLRLIAAERRRRDGTQVDVGIAVFETDAKAERGLQVLRETEQASVDAESHMRMKAIEAGARAWLTVRGLSARDPRMPAGMQQTIDALADGEVGGLVPLVGFDPSSLDPSFMGEGIRSTLTGTAVVYRMRTRSSIRAAVSNESIWQELITQDQTQRIDRRIADLLTRADVIIYDRDLQRAWQRGQRQQGR